MYAAEKMMEALEPPLHKDNPNPNLALWINRIRLSQNTIDSILSIKSDSERVVKTRYKCIPSCACSIILYCNAFCYRSSWSRLRAAQLFVEHVILKHSDVDLKLIARRLCMVSLYHAILSYCAYLTCLITLSAMEEKLQFSSIEHSECCTITAQ